MNSILRIFVTILVALLFGFTLSEIEPYPNSHGIIVLITSSTLFLIIAKRLRNPETKRTWIIYGVTTFACFAVTFSWFWFDAMSNQWWYPPQLPIIQQFFFVDGEAGYDAMVTNLFLVLWFIASSLFLARHLTLKLQTKPPKSPVDLAK